MARYHVFLVAASLVACAQAAAPARIPREANESRAFIAKKPVDDMTDIEFICMVESCNLATYFATAVIVSAEWIMGTGDFFTKMQKATSEICAFDSVVDISSDNKNKHKIKTFNIFVHPSYDPITESNSIAVAKVCTPFTNNLILPASRVPLETDTYAKGDNLEYYLYYSGVLNMAETEIEDPAKCTAELDGYNKPPGAQICITHIKHRNNVVGHVIIHKATKKLIGLRAYIQEVESTGPEMASALKFYKNWVVTTTGAAVGV